MNEETKIQLFMRRAFPKNGLLPTTDLGNQVKEFYENLEELQLDEQFRDFSETGTYSYTQKDGTILKLSPYDFLHYAHENRDRIDEKQYGAIYSVLGKDFGLYIRNN